MAEDLEPEPEDSESKPQDTESALGSTKVDKLAIRCRGVAFVALCGLDSTIYHISSIELKRHFHLGLHTVTQTACDELWNTFCVYLINSPWIE